MDCKGYCVVCDQNFDTCEHVRNVVKQTRRDFAQHIADTIIKQVEDKQENKRMYLKMLHKELINLNDPQPKYPKGKKRGRKPKEEVEEDA